MLGYFDYSEFIFNIFEFLGKIKKFYFIGGFIDDVLV